MSVHLCLLLSYRGPRHAVSRGADCSLSHCILHGSKRYKNSKGMHITTLPCICRIRLRWQRAHTPRAIHPPRPPSPRLRPLPAGGVHLVGSWCTPRDSEMPASRQLHQLHAMLCGSGRHRNLHPAPLARRLTDPPKGTVTVTVEEVVYVGSADNTSAAFSAHPLEFIFNATNYSENQVIFVTKSEQGSGDAAWCLLVVARATMLTGEAARRGLACLQCLTHRLACPFALGSCSTLPVPPPRIQPSRPSL